MRRAAAFALLLCASACAQTFSFDKDREPLTSLDGMWRFHTGDDLRWAAPDFDDSGWKLLRSDQSWATQGYKGYSGFAWYRFRVENLPKGKPISLLLPPIGTSYQVFANGEIIGNFGPMPPKGYLYSSMAEVLAIPPNAQSERLQLALRIWHSPVWASYTGGGPTQGGTYIGERKLINARLHSRRDIQLLRSDDFILLAVLELLAGLAALTLFLLRRSETEYFWFGCLMLAGTAGYSIVLRYSLYPGDAVKEDCLESLITTFVNLASIGFYQTVLPGRRSWLYWTAVASVPVTWLCWLAQANGLISSATENLGFGLSTLPISVWVISRLVSGWRARLPAARLLLVPILPCELYTFFVSLAAGSYIAGWQHIVTGRESLVTRPIPIHIDDLFEIFGVGALLAFLLYRFARTRRDEERLASEFEAARAVQHVLIPEKIPAVPGLQISSIYKPAQEVGGDFFQVIPVTGGSLIVIGDVSGKGLQAAMTVSLIVGTIRILTEYTQEPAELLNGLNQNLLGSGGGFTTCLIARICANGDVLIANAGHLPPYQDGNELVTAPDLPLGISGEVEYRESALQLEPGSRLTFISDGVVEAKDNQRQLFGFERARAISRQSAQAVAEAAIDFGQEDDITVLTIERVAIPEYA